MERTDAFDRVMSRDDEANYAKSEKEKREAREKAEPAARTEGK
jgi:hypothetical protein